MLTAVTTAIAFFDLGGEINATSPLSPSRYVKRLLVILYFMHVRYSDGLTWVFAAAGFFWLLILIGGTMYDVITRPQLSPSTASVPAQDYPR